MANEIDLVVGTAVSTQLDKLMKELVAIDLQITKIGQTAEKMNSVLGVKSTADLAKLTAENEKLNKKIQDLTGSTTVLETKLANLAAAQSRAAKAATDASIADEKLLAVTNKNTVATEKRTKATLEETIAQREATNQTTLKIKAGEEEAKTYAQLDAQHKIAVKNAQDLAVQTGRSGKAYEDAKFKANELGKQLRVIDTDIGKHTRNVGNYSSSWNGLGNSINQLTREAPAFANSVQTGFMALSNNIPILTDELGVLIQKNKDLQKEGKPTQSILKTVAGAFFSWQTAISLGVTILTVYGAKLVDMAMGLGNVEKSLKSLEKAQKDSDERISNTTRNIEAQTEIAIAKAKREGKSQKELDDIKITGQKDVLLNLQKERDLAKNTYDEAVNYRKNGIEGVKQRQRAELDAYNQSVAQRRKAGEEVSPLEQMKVQRQMIYKNEQEIKKIKGNASGEAFKTATDNYTKTEGAVKIHGQKLNVLNENLKTSQYEQAKKAQEKLDSLADKPEKKVLKFDEVKSEKDLEQAKIETNKIILQGADLDRMTTEEKIINREKLTQIELDAIKSIQEEEIAVADKKQIDDKVENDRALKNQTISREQYFQNIEDINKTHQNVVDKINVEASNKTQQLAYSDFKYQADLLQKDADNRQKYKINQFDSEKAAAKLLSEDNRKNEKLTSTERQSNFEKFKKISEEELASQRDFALSKTVIKTEQDLINQEYAKGIKLLENMSDPLEAIKNKTSDWLGGFTKTGLDNPLQAFGLESAKIFLDVKANGETAFSEMYKNAETSKEKFAVAFNSISEVGQGAFNAIAQASMAQYDGEYKRLEAQKENGLKFAGDSVVAKENIEKEYAKKKQEIDKRKFEAEKKISMVNIVIDTAQAVVATLAKGGGFFASPLAMIVAALGAAQLGMVAAQQFPAYAEGTDNHRGGMMLVNDGAGANFQEKVILPSGKVIRPQGRNVLMNAPKGTKVLNHEQQLFEMLQNNNISMSSQQNQGMTSEEMDEVLGKHFSNIKTQNTIFDKNGFQSYVKNGNSITRSNSNRSQAIGISV